MTRWLGGRCAVHSGLLWACLSMVGCGTVEPPQQHNRAAKRGRLAAGVVAEVGGRPVYAASVAAIATRQGLTMKEARAAAVYDALLAVGADREVGARARMQAERRVLARVILREIHQQSARKPIDDDELRVATEARWLHVDRPVGYRTVHVLARVQADASEEHDNKARAVAERLERALRAVGEEAAARSPPSYDVERMFESIHVANIDPATAAFIKAVRALATDGVDVLAEPLQVIAADRRILDTTSTGGEYDATFVEAATALAKRGDLSGVVKSAFGYHIIMLLEVTPARRLSRAARLEALRDGLLRGRGARQQQALLDELGNEYQPASATNIDALLKLVLVSP